MTKYKCITAHFTGLTMGAVYRDYSENRNPFNALLINDEGDYVYVDKVHLEEVICDTVAS